MDRSILTNNLIYAIHYMDGCGGLYAGLLTDKGEIIVDDLYGNLMEGSNTEAVVLLDVPTAVFTNAAVIQLRRGMPVVPALSEVEVSGVEPGDVVVYEGLLYIDEDADGLDSEAERQLGTSDYCVDSDGDGVSDYEEYFHKKHDPVLIEPRESRPNDEAEDKDKDPSQGVIYVDQATGNDSLSGRASAVAGKDGPKKTVGKGMAAVDEDRAHTLVIKSGTYNEDLDIRGKNLQVVIEGNVKL